MVQPPPSDPFTCLDIRFPLNTCRHGKMIEFQCLGSGAKWSGVGVQLDFSVNFRVVWSDVIPRKIDSIVREILTQQFLEFPRLLKHHQIHPQKLLRFLSISACPSGWLGMAMPLYLNIGHVSYRVPVLCRAKRKKADKAGKESQIRLTLDRGPPPSNLWFFSGFDPIVFITIFSPPFGRNMFVIFSQPRNKQIKGNEALGWDPRA